MGTDRYIVHSSVSQRPFIWCSCDPRTGSSRRAQLKLLAMAFATSSSRAGLVKAVVLPLLLVLLGVAAGASVTEDGAAVAISGGRFSETPVGRKLLGAPPPALPILACGLGYAPIYNCSTILPNATQPACCTDAYGNQACFDVGGGLVTKCGSCNTVCPSPEFCCSGVCVDQLTDVNNCGACGNKCAAGVKCKSGFCGY